MKAILHNREDDLHFLLKCLIEELQDNSILKVAQKDMPKDKLANDVKDKAEKKLVELGALPDLDYKRGERATTGESSRATKRYDKTKLAMKRLLDLVGDKEKVTLFREAKERSAKFNKLPVKLDFKRVSSSREDKELQEALAELEEKYQEEILDWVADNESKRLKQIMEAKELKERIKEVKRRESKSGKPFFQPTSPEESDFEAISPKRLLGIYSGKDTVAELETLKDNPEVKRVLDTMSKKTIRLQRKGKKLSDKQIKTQLNRLASGKEKPKGMKDTLGYGKIKDTYIKIYNQLVTALNKTKKENPEKGKKIQDFIDTLANRKEVVDNKLFADERKEQEVSESTPKFFNFLLKNLEEAKENLEKGGKTAASNKLRTMFKNTNYDNPQFIMDGINIVLNKMKPKEEPPKAKPEVLSLPEDKYPKRKLFGREVFDKERIRGRRPQGRKGALSEASKRMREAERKKLQFKKQDTGEMFRYFDAKKVKGKWVWDVRQFPLADGEAGVNTLKAVIDGLSSILKDSEVMNAVVDAFEELTGRSVQGIDTETKKKRKKLRSIKEKRFKKITDRRRKMMIAGIGIPKTVVNKYIKAEEEASTGLFKVLERLAKMRIVRGVFMVDDSIVVNDTKDTEGDLKVRAKTVTPMVKKITLDEKGLKYNKEIEKPKYVSYFPSIESKDNEKLTTPEVLEQVWDRYIERAEELEKELKAGKPSKQIQILNYTEEQIKKKIKTIAGLQDFDPKEGKIKEKTLSKEGQKLLDKIRQELRILMKSNQSMKKEFSEQNKSRAEKNHKAISEFLKKNIKDAETGENLFDALDDFTEMFESFKNMISQLEGERESIYAGKDKKRIAKIAQAYTKKFEQVLVDANTVKKLTTIKEELKFMDKLDVRDFKGGGYSKKPKEVTVTNALKEMSTKETLDKLRMDVSLPVSLTKDIIPLAGSEVFSIVSKLFPSFDIILEVFDGGQPLRKPRVYKGALKQIKRAIEEYISTDKVRDRSKGIIDKYNEGIEELNKGIDNLIETFSKNKTFIDLSQLTFEYIPMVEGRQGEKENVSLYDAFDIGRQIKEEKTAEILDPEKEGFSRMTLAAFAVDEFRDYLKELRRLEKEHEESVKAANKLEVQFIDVVDFRIEQLKTLENNLNKIDEKGQLDDKTEPLGYLERILSVYSQSLGIGKKGDK
tara:strand:- start:186 stop:3704 length:3519 start_codon:yes stop_codon:yes gene_type:complete